MQAKPRRVPDDEVEAAMVGDLGIGDVETDMHGIRAQRGDVTALFFEGGNPFFLHRTLAWAFENVLLRRLESLDGGFVLSLHFFEIGLAY